MIKLEDMLLRDILAKVAEPNAQLGGGSAILIGASLGVSLVSKAIEATLKKNVEDKKVLNSSNMELLKAREQFLHLAVEDGSSYDKVLGAKRVVIKGTKEEIEARDWLIEAAWNNSVKVPLQAAELCVDCVKYIASICKILRRDFRYDVVSALRLLETCLLGCLDNALDNSEHLSRLEARQSYKERAQVCEKEFKYFRSKIFEPSEGE